jgi:hypothetical protein
MFLNKGAYAYGNKIELPNIITIDICDYKILHYTACLVKTTSTCSVKT